MPPSAPPLPNGMPLRDGSRRGAAGCSSGGDGARAFAAVLGDVWRWIVHVLKGMGDIWPYWLALGQALKTAESALTGLGWRPHRCPGADGRTTRTTSRPSRSGGSFASSWTTWRGLGRKPTTGCGRPAGRGGTTPKSKVMAWLAFDRAIALSKRFGLEAPVHRWKRDPGPDPR